MPASSFGLALSSSSASAAANVSAALANPFHLPLYGYDAADPAFSANPNSYSESSCSESAKAREESYKKIDGYPVRVYTKSDPCALEKMVVGIALQAEGVDESENEFLGSLRNVGTLGVTDTQTVEPVGSLLDSSVGVPCAAGTTDKGTEDGYNNGALINIRLCAVPGTHSSTTNPNDTKGQSQILVNSRVSSLWLNVVSSMKNDLNKSVIEFTSSFRSNLTQAGLYAAYNHGAGNPASPPGYSNHQLGAALDFKLDNNRNQASLCVTVNNICTPPNSDPVYDWLVANSTKYGIKQNSGEYWHWEPKGI